MVQHLILMLHLDQFKTHTSSATLRLDERRRWEENVTDSITVNLKKQERLRQLPHEKIKWFALIKENGSGYDVIINEHFGNRNSPINQLIKKSSRHFLVKRNFQIPVLFESDMLSTDIQKQNIGSINWGGYYFKIEKINGDYSVTETAIFF